MAYKGTKRWVDFRISDVNGNPVAGLLLGGFTTIFTRNNVACADALSLIDCGAGRYILNYIPSAVGHDYLELYDANDGVRIVDSEDVMIDPEQTGVIQFVESWASPNQFQLQVAEPQSYTLAVIESSVWQAGTPNLLSAVASTQLDADGNWITSPLTILPGVYHIAAFGPTGQVVVLAAFLMLNLS